MQNKEPALFGSAGSHGMAGNDAMHHRRRPWNPFLTKKFPNDFRQVSRLPIIPDFPFSCSSTMAMESGPGSR
jgi:hypothetical protein